MINQALFQTIITFIRLSLSLSIGQGIEFEVALNQMYDGSPRDESHPLYEEIGEVRVPYVNMSPSDSSTRDSALMNNPIYGGEERNIGDSFYTTSVDDYDQAFQPPAPADTGLKSENKRLK